MSPDTNAPAPAQGAGYRRLLQTLRGDVPKIETVGIITAANPSMSERSSVAAETNIWRNAELLHDLATYATRQIKGRFGELEHPYLVSNLPRGRLVALGVKYAQDTVIFACCKGGSTLGMGFELVCTSVAKGTVGNAVATRKMLLQPGQQVKEHAQQDGTDRSPEFSIRYRGRRFEVPFFDQDPAGDEEFRGGRVLSYCAADIPAQAKKFLDAYLAAQMALEAALRERASTGHHLYVRRGVLANARVALFEAMDDWQPFPLRWERTW